MLVQLHRVVYLLVLLQCSFCVCLASAEKSTDPETDNAFNLSRNALKESIFHVNELIAKRAVCMEKGIESINDYDKKSKEAMDVKKVMETRVEEMGRSIESTAGAPGAGNSEVDLQALKERLEGVQKEVTKAREAVKKAMTSLAWVEYVHDTCWILSNSMEEEEEHLRRHVDAFQGFFRRVNKRDEMEQLAEKGNKTLSALSEQKEKNNKYEESNLKRNLTADRDLEGMGDEVASWSAYLSGYSKVVAELMTKSGRKVIGELLQTKLKEVIQELEVKREKDRFNAEIQTVRTAVEEEEKKKLEEAMKAEAQRVVEQRKEGEPERERKAQEEKKEREAGESKEKAEKARKEKEKEEKKAKAPEKEQADKDKEEAKGGAEQAEKTRKEEEEEKVKAPGKEQADKVKEEANGEVEGKTKVEQERKEKEAKKLWDDAEKRIKEEQEKLGNNIDGSSSPALAHSPLLLLLLCVLGSILVF